MRMFTLVRGAAAVALGLSLPAMAQDIPAAADKEVDFEADIKPILEMHCVECHREEKVKSGLRLDLKSEALKGGIEGAWFDEADSAHSLLIELVTDTNPDFDRMPPDGDPLTDEEIGLLRAWIEQGVQWPDGVTLVAVEKPEPEDSGEMVTTGTAEGLPEHYKVEATNQQGPLASWGLSQYIKGPNGEPVIAMTAANDDERGTYNLLWSGQRPFQNGSIEILVKALSGEVDQGGGIMWRVQDKNNYYVARINPLENNFRFYKVVDGERSEIASADYTADEGAWVSLKIEQQGNAFTGYLDGEKTLEATDDAIGAAGGVGFWTKADAATAFVVKSIAAE